MEQSSKTRLVEILILEDDADTREMLAQVFEANMCVARTASNLAEAEAALRERLPDVVLADLHLGGGEAGWVFAERARDDARTSHVGRIGMSGADVDPQAAAAFDACIRKPFDTARLVRLVRHLAAASRVERMMAERQTACA